MTRTARCESQPLTPPNPRSGNTRAVSAHCAARPTGAWTLRTFTPSCATRGLVTANTGTHSWTAGTGSPLSTTHSVEDAGVSSPLAYRSSNFAHASVATCRRTTHVSCGYWQLKPHRLFAGRKSSSGTTTPATCAVKKSRVGRDRMARVLTTSCPLCVAAHTPLTTFEQRTCAAILRKVAGSQ